MKSELDERYKYRRRLLEDQINEMDPYVRALDNVATMMDIIAEKAGMDLEDLWKEEEEDG